MKKNQSEEKTMNTYTPAYYSSFQETVTTLCKSILLPFSHKNRRLPADQKLAKKQSDHLKWQQESFHKILNLIELRKEGIVSESEVDSFKSHLLDTLISSPSEKEAIGVVKDKLLFLQELYYAKCISSDEYHSSKRPLLQRLAVEGVEIDCKDVIIGRNTTEMQEKENKEEEWSNIDLKDKEINEAQTENSKKHKTPIKAFMKWKGKDKKNSNKKPTNNENSSSILVPEVTPKAKRRPFISLFDKEDNSNPEKSKKVKKQWRFEGLAKWKRSDVEEDDCTSSLFDYTVVASPIGEGHDTKGIKEKIHQNGSSSNIKMELTRIQSELSSTRPIPNLFDDQMKETSTRLPVDKTDLNKFFPKPWCNRYGDMVMDVANKVSKSHVEEMEMILNNDKEKSISSNDDWKKWVAFNDEDYHPNLFSRDDPKLDGGRNSESYGKDCYLNNPFVDDQNPFFVSKN